MSGSKTTHFAKRVAKGLYTRLPFAVKTHIESLVAPLSFRIFTRGIIAQNLELGDPPFQPLSVVIPSYNDVHLLKPLLRSLHKTLQNFEYEIIISDDYCQEHNSEQLRGLISEKVRVIFSEKRTGFAGAVNRGIHEARFDVILLNSDIIALDYWAENLQAAAYNIDPKIGLVSPHLLYPTGRIQYGGTFHATVLAPQWFSHLDQGRFANSDLANVGKYVIAISGACVYIKRELLEKIKGLDENYWLGFEDVDLAFSARDHGYRSYLEPSSKLVHLESASRGKVQGSKEYSSLRRFWDKWRRQIEDKQSISTIDLFLSDEAPLYISLLAEKITHLMKQEHVQVTTHKVNPKFRIDETAISSTSTKNSFKVALDKHSVETVWLSSEINGIPSIYIPSLTVSNFDVSKPKDLALFKPEFTFIFGNSEDQATASAQIPWAIEKTLAPPALTQVVRGEELHPSLHNPIIRIVCRKENSPSAIEKMLHQAGYQTACSTEEEVLSLLTQTSPDLLNEIVLFTEEFDSYLIPLTLSAQGILYISVFSEKTKFIVMDGFNTFCFPKSDFDRAAYLVKHLADDPVTQNEVRKNGVKTAQSVDKSFCKNFLNRLNGRNSEVLPLSK